ncbi:hypothetical protein AB205_0158080, partial [Aquarana catesbeiana]
LFSNFPFYFCFFSTPSNPTLFPYFNLCPYITPFFTFFSHSHTHTHHYDLFHLDFPHGGPHPTLLVHLPAMVMPMAVVLIPADRPGIGRLCIAALCDSGYCFTGSLMQTIIP